MLSVQESLEPVLVWVALVRNVINVISHMQQESVRPKRKNVLTVESWDILQEPRSAKEKRKARRKLRRRRSQQMLRNSKESQGKPSKAKES